MRIVRAENHRRMPWKNGGGETTEIAVYPDGAGLDDFDWRVSMARVESSGPFSAFAGIDRTLAILDGEGLMLDIAGRDPVELTGASVPFSFPADSPTSASLLAGPIIDLNVMTRRRRLTHKVTRREVTGSFDIGIDAAETLLLCHSGLICVDGAGPAVLRRFDALMFGMGQSSARLKADGRAVFFLIEIRNPS